MAYALKYLLSFVSERGNDYKIQVLEKDYAGEPTLKKLGSAPILTIDESDGCIQGSSLSFSIQADVDGELQGLYTTDNKQYKVVLIKNDVSVWVGFLLPELYSENYVYPPYDVSLTASDGLATLKALTYQRNDSDVTLKSIIEGLLELTQIYLPVCYHLQISHNARQDVFVDKVKLNQAAYNGYNCYDVLSALLQSMNCRLMQLNGQWLIVSATDSSNAYYIDGALEVREAKSLGQLGVSDVSPSGSLTMVNSPALKGATLEYSHILRNSLLVNADCTSRGGWSFLPNGGVDENLPGVKEEFGKTLLLNAWGLNSRNIANDNSLQLWQDVAINADEGVPYSLSVKYLFSTNDKILLMSVNHQGSDGVSRQLTVDGWVTQFNKADINSYIQITGTPKGLGASGIADIEQYEESTVQFMLPPVDGTLRVGFINSTENYANPLAYAPIYVTQVYLTLGDVTGSVATTVVQENATTGQEGVLLVYGDDIPESVNAARLTLNTLKRTVATTSWWLEGQEFASYFLLMLQEFSRFYGTKKRQLNGTIMGEDVLANIYHDTYSGLFFRLITAQYNLLDDEASVLLEEIVEGFVDYVPEVFATNNGASLGSTLSGGSSGSNYVPGGGGGNGGDSGEGVSGLTKVTIITQAGEEYSTNESGIVIIPNYITASALNGYATQNWVKDQGYAKNADVVTLNTGITNLGTRVTTVEGNISTNATNITKLSNRLAKLEAMWEIDENGNLHTTYAIVSDKDGIFGEGGSSGGGGTAGGLGSVIIKTEGGVEYKTNSNGVVTVPNWITASALNGYATQSWVEGKKYITGITSAMVTTALGFTPYNSANFTKANIKSTLGISDWALAASKPSYAWSEIASKPTTVAGYGIADTLTFTNNGTYVGANLRSSDLSNLAASAYIELWDTAGWWNLKAAKYIVAGGTSSHFLKGDGSLDATAYLPLSGGTISSGAFNPLTIKGNNSYAGIGFQKTSDSLPSYLVYVNEWDWRITNANWADSKKILHSGNYSSYALPLTGGTIAQDSIAFPLIIKGTSAQAGVIFKDASGTNKGAISWENGAGTYIYNYSSAAYIGVKDDGTPHYKGNVLYHAGNFTPSDYLPLSGGTISASGWNKQLGVNRTEATGAVLIGFYNNNTFRGGFGFNAANSPVYGNTNGESRVILTQDNYSSYALSLSGGTLTTSSIIPLYVNSTNANQTLVRIDNNSNAKTGIGWRGDNGMGTFLYNYASGSYLSVKDDGTPNYNGNTLIHSGNISSQSVSKAKTLTTQDGLSMIYLGSNALYIGDNTYSSVPTYILGNSVALRYGASATFGLTLNENGNVLIGTTSNRTNIKLNVNGTVMSSLSSASNDAMFYAERSDLGYMIGLGVGTSSNRGIYDTALGWCFKIDTANGLTIVGHEVSGNIVITDKTGSSTTSNRLIFARNTRADDYWDFGLYAQSTKGLTFFQSSKGVNTDIGNLDGYGNFVASGSGTFGSDINSAGTIYGTIDGVFGSDARYKAVQQNLDVDLETIANAPVFTYRWTHIEDKALHLGTTAQYWINTSFKAAVNTDNPDFYHLNYGGLGVAIGITNARWQVKIKNEQIIIKNEQIIIKNEQIKVKSEVERLRERVNELENQVKQLRQWHN